MASKRVVVVGGGMGGLSAAVRLAHRGHAVTVVEKNERVGGKLNVWRDGGFTFDTGPSLLTLPAVFEELFASVGERLSEHLVLRRLDPIQRFVWQDGQTAEIRQDGRLEGLGETAAREWAAFLERGRRIWDLSADMFLWHAPEQLLNQGPFDGRKALSMLTIPLRIGVFSRFASEVHRRVRHPRVREILYQYATYAGASPFRAPGTLGVIPYAECGFGGWYVEGGLYRIAEAVEGLIRARGGIVRTGCEVTGIEVAGLARTRAGKRAAVAGVRLANGETLPADAVVMNADVVPAYRNLIPATYRRKYSEAALDRIEPGGSGMVLLLGVEGEYPQLAHHTKFMPADYRSDLRAMFETKTVPEDPCIYVCASTRTDPSQAPPGCENLFVLVSAPSLQGSSIDWAVEGPRYRDRVIQTLETRWGLTGLFGRIRVEKRYTPADLQRVYHANQGSIYGIGSNSRLGAFLRPPNRDREIEGLFLAGGATHPGGGLPLVTLSGKIVAEMIGDGNQPPMGHR